MCYCSGAAVCHCRSAAEISDKCSTTYCQSVTLIALRHHRDDATVGLRGLVNRWSMVKRLAQRKAGAAEQSCDGAGIWMSTADVIL